MEPIETPGPALARTTRPSPAVQADELLIELVQQAQTDAAQLLTVLLVEDDPEDTKILRRAFVKAVGPQFQLEHVDSLRLALHRLSSGGIHLVVLDLCLPDARGLEVVTQVHAAAPHVPIVVLTGLKDEEIALAAILAGAQDYVVKWEMDSNLIVRSLQLARERHLVGQSLRMKSAELGLANLKLEELNRQKDEFISRVSHELRTPLTAIYQFATIMADGLAGETTPEQREYLEVVLRNVKEIRNMVGELLDTTRAEAGKLHVQPRRLSIARLLDETLTTTRILALNKGIALHANVSRDLPPAFADPQRVRQILTNLIDNAIKFTPQNGSIGVDVKVLAEDPHFLLIEVQDTGEGLRPEVQARVFERLYQDDRASQSRQGLGLGLYICKQLVTVLGGRIWAENVDEGGSRFSFTLPVFSLPELLEPVLKSNGRLVDAATLFRIELVQKRTLVPRRSLQRALQECRSILGGRAFTTLALVPEMSFESTGRVVLALAAVGEPDARGLADRMRDALGHEFSRRFVGLQAEVSHTDLRLRADAAEAIETSLSRVAARIEAAAAADASAPSRATIELATVSS